MDTEPHIALVTTGAARELDDDLAPLVDALRQRNMRVACVDWDDAQVDWTAFDLALLRSPWDYTRRLAEFLDWATRTGACTRLLNPLSVIRWNTDKHYLAELAAADVPVVASTFIEPEHAVDASMQHFLSANDAAEFVVKPAVGAGSRDAQRYGREEIRIAMAHAQRLLDDRRSVLVQPYLRRVDTNGETALIFFDGVFCHAIRKGALLKRGEGPTRALFAAEHIVSRTPSSDEVELAQRTLAAMPFDQPLLYARVDVIRADDDSPRLLELELTEPSLFFNHAPGSVETFAQAIEKRVRR
ncbi:MAG TPA: hypothetical protein VFN13_08760 [Rudaea sp.]|nr:hypothetical protein [Rudaea sp.]